MVTDDERREVARRLREVQADVIPGTKTEVHPIAGRIIGVACGYDLPDFQGLLGRLADLIEPSIPADPGEVGLACVDAFIREHTEKPVDRDALLALAEEMDMDAGCHAYVDDYSMYEYARRIREALGVEK